MSDQPPLFDVAALLPLPRPVPEPVRLTIPPPKLVFPPEAVTIVLVPLDPAALPHRLKGLLKDALRRYRFEAKVVRVPTELELLYAAEWL